MKIIKKTLTNNSVAFPYAAAECNKRSTLFQYLKERIKLRVINLDYEHRDLLVSRNL